jgi:homoaconitase/3-isopropylmalate dehydratase large subunit
MRQWRIQHCDRTGRIVGHCGCGACYARRLESLVREDRTLQTSNRPQPHSPRYLVTNAL